MAQLRVMPRPRTSERSARDGERRPRTVLDEKAGQDVEYERGEAPLRLEQQLDVAREQHDLSLRNG